MSVPYPRWQRRHEAVLHWLFEHPTGTLAECARDTGYSRPHLSRITCSPDFRQYLGALRADVERQLLAHYVEGLTARKHKIRQ